MKRSITLICIGLLNISVACGFIYMWLVFSQEFNMMLFRDGTEPNLNVLGSYMFEVFVPLAFIFVLMGFLSIRQKRGQWIGYLCVVAFLMSVPFLFLGGVWNINGVAALFSSVTTFLLNRQS